MKKIIVVGFAILAVSTSGALAKKAKPKVEAAPTFTPATPFTLASSAADKKMYMKNKHDSGVK